MTNRQKNIIGIWNFFQKLKHNCSKKKAETFLDSPIEAENFPTPTYIFEKNTLEQKKWSRIYREKSKTYIPLLRFLPGIRAVAVCNSVALGTADKNSDIDLLIITEPNKLWTARIFSTLFLQILGVRRHGNKIAGRFCLSFFITENVLDFHNIALKPRDPYLAFWISSLVPIFGQESFQKISKLNTLFIQENANIIPKFNSEVLSLPIGESHIRSFLEILFGKWFEGAMKKLFLKRTEGKRDLLHDSSGTVITDDMLKFHNTDKRNTFL